MTQMQKYLLATFGLVILVVIAGLAGWLLSG